MDEMPEEDLATAISALLRSQLHGLMATAEIITLAYGDDDVDASAATKEAWAAYRRLRELTIMPARDLYAALAKKEAGNDA